MKGSSMLRSRILVLACLPVLALAGCSDSTDDTPGTGTSGPAAAAAGDGAAADSGGPSAKMLCDFLRAELPTLQSIGGKVGAEGQLAVDLANLATTAGKLKDGAEMDDLTTKECADVRTDVLKAIGKNSFDELG
jgi:hypothetical protein